MEDAQPETGSVSEGVLDFDAAVNQLSALEDERPEDEAQENTAEADEPEADEASEAEPTAEDSDAEPEEEPTADAEDEEEPEAEDPPIQAPHSWDKDAKERFAKLDRETQEYLVNRENERDRAVSQKLNEAAEQRKSFEEASAKVEQYVQSMAQIAEKASKVFADRWQNVNWQELAQSNPAEYVRLEAQFKAEQATLHQTQQAQQKAEQIELAQFTQREGQRLQELAPELAQSAEKKAELAKYLTDGGVSQENLKWASATELSIAYKAMMYDRLQAQPAPTKPRSEKPAPKTVRPAAEAKSKPRRVQQAESAMKRLSKSGSVEDAIAALNARES